MRQGGGQMGRMMLVSVLGVLASTIPAHGARHVTVSQLEQFLAADQATHRSDALVARQLSDLELSERLTDGTLNLFANRFSLGPRTALTLQLLSDQSALLDPPASELPATALPDAATQQRMMDKARGYAVERWTHLPDFFVTRVTNRFDDSPQVLEAGSWPVRAGLHLVGNSSRMVTFRDGHEVQDPTAQNTSSIQGSAQQIGLHTWGEFGPALSVVLSDLAKGSVSFSHWEQAATGLVAVFRYEVPHAASHYAVQYCCQVDEHLVGRTQFGYSGHDRSPKQVASIPRGDDVHPYEEVPAYKGELSIDPASGAIIRVTLEADLKSGGPLNRAATVIEYGPVAVGSRNFILPVRSLALSVQEAGRNGHPGPSGSNVAGISNESEWQGAVSGVNREPVFMLNETRFTDYHRLGATMRIVNDAAGNPEPLPGSPAAAAGSSTETASGPPSAPAPEPEAVAGASVPEPAPATPPAPPAEPVIPEISVSAANAVPDALPGATRPQEPDYFIKVTSRLVDVGVVVTDKKGKPVKDLAAANFEIYDNGQRQEIRSFSEIEGPSAAQPVATAEASSQAESAHSFSNRAAADPALATQSHASSVTVLLIDESHIAWSDMARAREQVLKFLSSLAPGERVGLYVVTRTGFRVLVEITDDHPALASQLKSWTPAAQSVMEAQDEETRNRQQFDEVHSVNDLNYVNGNQNEMPDGQSTTDPMLRTMGSTPARDSLVQLLGVARHLSAVPGHKNLVWISSDNVFADWQNQAVGIEKSPTKIDSFSLRAQEAMNEAHVAVYPFDVSQLEGGGINADIRTRNVELTQAAADTAALGGGSGSGGGGRNMDPGRVTAQMQQDIHPIQGPVREVAAATGGRVIRRSSDLAGELAGIVDDGHATYMLSFSPAGPADGQYHNISVKLTGKRGVELRYRTGYLFEKEPATLKERFQQAVWRPMDVNEIAVAADVQPSSEGANIKVSIATADLGLQQQADRWLDKLDIFFIQRDDEGRHAQVEGQTLGLRLKPATYQRLMSTGVPFEHFVRMHQEMASLRVLVVDENSGRMGSITIPAPAMKAGHP